MALALIKRSPTYLNFLLKKKEIPYILKTIVYA